MFTTNLVFFLLSWHFEMHGFGFVIKDTVLFGVRKKCVPLGRSSFIPSGLRNTSANTVFFSLA